MTPVIGLPGILIGYASWEPVKNLVCLTGRHFLAHSFPGYDYRPRLPYETPTPFHYAVDIEESSPRRAHLLAHCSGCTPALAYAVHYPERVASVTLISYWHGTKEWESRKEVLSLGTRAYAKERVKSVIAHPTRDPQLPQRLEDWIVHAMTDLEGFLQMTRTICYHSAKGLLAEVKQPVHFIVGRRDAVTLPEAQVRVADRKGARVTILDCGHCPNFEEPHAVVRACDRFWREVGE